MKFTVKSQKSIFQMVAILTIIVAGVCAFFTMKDGINDTMMIWATILMLPLWIGVLWINSKKIIVEDQHITVKNGFKSFSFDVSQINRITWITSETRMGKNENVKVQVNDHHFVVDPMMQNAAQMREYLKCQVSSERIVEEYHNFLKQE